MTTPRLVIWVCLSACPGVVFAHSPIEGVGNFYNGLLHPVFVPAHLLALLGLGVVFGQQEDEQIKIAMAVVVIATAIGLATTEMVDPFDTQVMLLILTAILGVLIAAQLTLARYLYALLGLLTGLLVGLDSPQEELVGGAKMIALFGSWIGVLVLVLYPVALVRLLSKRPWQRIGVRVLGSWIAASSFLVLSLSALPGKS